LPILDFPGTGHDPRLSQISASALCPREKEQRLCGPSTASANGITPRRRTLLRSTRSGEQQVPVLGSRAYRNHSTRLRVFPLPRGEGRCELVRKCAKRVKDRDRLTARPESSSRREEALHRFCFRGNLSLVTSAATGSGVFKQALKHARVVCRRR